MKKRCKLWMADWRDADGVRHRKGFKTQRSAGAFARRMKEAADTAKKAPASRVRKSSPRRGSNRSNRRTIAT
jgi:hypothetical protein